MLGYGRGNPLLGLRGSPRDDGLGDRFASAIIRPSNA